jgi:uncharacterized protein (TIGR02996 family)
VTLPWHSLTPFLRAVAESPADDTTRLAFADWLDDEGERERCPGCYGKGYSRAIANCLTKNGYKMIRQKCPQCSGSGWTPGVCQRWAELVRVQCELARIRCWVEPEGDMEDEAFQCACGACCKWHELRRRESTLLPGLAPVLIAGPRCERCEGTARVDTRLRDRGRERFEDCPTCHGTGATGPLARLAPDAVAFRRGFPAVVRVERLEQVWDVQRDKPTAWGMEVVRAWPVEEIVAGDRPAFQSGGLWYLHADATDVGWSLSDATKGADGYFGRSSAEAMTTAFATAIVTLTRAAAAKPSAAETVA